MSALDDLINRDIVSNQYTGNFNDSLPLEARKELAVLRTRIAELERECLHLAKELSPKHYCQPPEEK